MPINRKLITDYYNYRQLQVKSTIAADLIEYSGIAKKKKRDKFYVHKIVDYCSRMKIWKYVRT